MFMKQKKIPRPNRGNEAIKLAIRESWSESERNKRRSEAILLQDGLLGVVGLNQLAMAESKFVRDRQLLSAR